MTYLRASRIIWAFRSLKFASRFSGAACQPLFSASEDPTTESLTRELSWKREMRSAGAGAGVLLGAVGAGVGTGCGCNGKARK